MNETEFKRLFMCKPSRSTKSEYPELRNKNNHTGIYSHICPKCKDGFFGYKRRVLCFDCELNEDGLAK